MILPPLLATSLVGLAHHKLRSLLTMLGMVFGVGAVIAMLAISEGARSEALGAIQQMGMDRVLVKSVRPTVKPKTKDDKNDTSNVLAYGLTFKDRQHLARVVPDMIENVATRQVRQKVFNGSREIETRIIATEPLYAAAAHLSIASGRFICQLDMERLLPVAVLGAEVARDLFRLQDPLGKDVQISGQWLRVVGVLENKRTAGIGGLGAEDLNRTIFIPETSAKTYFGLLSVEYEAGSYQVSRLEIAQLVMRFAGTADVLTAGALVRKVLGRTHERGDIEVVVPLELLEQQRRTQTIFAIVMFSIASISLLVGGIGIMNIMLANVLERTREIGIRRAVGARRSDIRNQFLVETVVMAMVGGLVGILVGLVGAALVNELAGWPILITPWSVMLSVGISMVVGVVAGLSPAVKAARMQPVEALRHA